MNCNFTLLSLCPLCSLTGLSQDICWALFAPFTNVASEFMLPFCWILGFFPPSLVFLLFLIPWVWCINWNINLKFLTWLKKLRSSILPFKRSLGFSFVLSSILSFWRYWSSLFSSIMLRTDLKSGKLFCRWC